MGDHYREVQKFLVSLKYAARDIPRLLGVMETRQAFDDEEPPANTPNAEGA